jgi:F5/8 type C domain./Glycosyl hydrolases family 2, sugar binding domain.
MNMNFLRLMILSASVSLSFASCSDETHIFNVAENKAAWASSSYDYNLTAQLVTDGRVETDEPAWLKVSTPDGELPRREREWTVDKGPYSKSTLSGEDTFIEYEWSRQSFKTPVVRVTGFVIHRPGAASWSIDCLAAAGGVEYSSIGGVSGTSLPGEANGVEEASDPNKQYEAVSFPRRKFCLEIPVEAVSFSRLKLVFRMKGVVSWMINAVDIAEDGGFGLNSDSFGAYDSRASRGQNVLPSECFTSAWMSADDQPQWVYVDLGRKQKVSRVRLHWIHKPSEAAVEFSDNGDDWTTAASFPASDSLVCDVAAKGFARYVRVSMSGADETGHFCLSEMEVLGPEAPEVAKTAWMLQRASDVDASGEEISTNEFTAEGWMPAVVPGTVLYSYIAAGAVPEPAYSDNNNQISESFFNCDFWYRGVVEQEGGSGERSLLEFDGVNWKAEIFMDGKRVGDIAGAFKKGLFDVTDIVNASGSGKHIVAVHIVKNANFAAVKEKNAESPDFNGGALGADNPTFHATVGWDWIPTVRGREMGIWNDARLVASERWTLRNPLVESKIAADGKASVKAGVELTNLSSEALTGTLEGAIGPMAFSKEVTVGAGRLPQWSSLRRTMLP